MAKNIALTDLIIPAGSSVSNVLNAATLAQIRALLVTGPDAVDAGLTYKIQVTAVENPVEADWAYLQNAGADATVGQAKALPIVGAPLMGLRIQAVNTSSVATNVGANRAFKVSGHNPWLS